MRRRYVALVVFVSTLLVAIPAGVDQESAEVVTQREIIYPTYKARGPFEQKKFSRAFIAEYFYGAR